MRTAVVILNWNGRRFLERFLPDVVDSSGPQVDVVVADNASTDGSVRFLEEEFPRVHLVRFDQNFGYTGGYNRALTWVREHLAAEVYVLLNSDVQTPHGWLEPLIQRLAASPRIAACMPKIRSQIEPQHFEYAGAAGGFIDRFGYPYCRGRILSHIEPDRGQYDTPIPIHWASGACLAIRAEIFWEVGGLCENFFAHMEEIDLCWRLARAGYEIWCEPAAVVYHVGGGALPNESPRKLFLNYRNSLLMLRRNTRGLARAYTLTVRMLIDLASAMVYLASGRIRSFTVVVRAHAAFWRMRRDFPFLPVRNSATSRLQLASCVHILWQFVVLRRRTFAELRSRRNIPIATD